MRGLAAHETDLVLAPREVGMSEESAEPKGRPCPFCGASMMHRHCKYVCPQHGVVYDCADTFY